MPEFEKRTIMLTVDSRIRKPTQPIDAFVIGSLAVHRGYIPEHPELKATYWVITHVPSGYKIAEGNKQRTCKALAKQLADLQWDFPADSIPQETWDVARPIIRAFISDTSN